MPSKISYTSKTLAKLRKDGYRADIVERRIYKNIVNDYLGVIDIIALAPGKLLGVQSTSYKQASKHRKIIREKQAELSLWKSVNGKFELWLWRKPVGKHRWEVVIEEY